MPALGLQLHEQREHRGLAGPLSWSSVPCFLHPQPGRSYLGLFRVLGWGSRWWHPGPQRFSGLGCCLLGFTSPGRGRPAPRASAQPRQEELVADVSLCANPWLLASGASTRRLPHQGGSLGLGRAPRPYFSRLGPHGRADCPQGPLGRRSWCWTPVRNWAAAMGPGHR